MGASVRIEGEAFGDARFVVLGDVAGYNAYEALGRMAYLWRHCTQRGAYVVSEAVVRACLGPNGVEAITAADLGECVDGGVRVKGTHGRVEWLGELRGGNAAGGTVRATTAERRPDGTFAPAKRQSEPAEASKSQTLDQRSQLGPAPSSVPIPIPMIRHDQEPQLLQHSDVLREGVNTLGWKRPGNETERTIAALCPITADEFADAVAVTNEQATKPGFGYFVSVVESNRKAKERARAGPPRLVSKQDQSFAAALALMEKHNASLK